MATLGTAVLPSDSDPDDEDYEDAGAENDGPAPRRRRRHGCQGAGDESMDDDDDARAQKKQRAAEKIWAEMAAEARAVAARRPPCAPLDALSRQFQRRHPRPPKQRSRRAVFAELTKYSNAVAADAPPQPSAAELKRQVRSAAVAARATSAMTPAPARPRPAVAVVEDTVCFAGERVTVRRNVPVGSREEQQYLQAEKRRKKVQLGGQLASLDAFLGSAKGERGVSVIKKSNLDWQAHKDKAGLDNLRRDPHAGALERKAFLARAKARSEEVAKAARLAARPPATQHRVEPP